MLVATPCNVQLEQYTILLREFSLARMLQDANASTLITATSCKQVHLSQSSYNVAYLESTACRTDTRIPHLAV